MLEQDWAGAADDFLKVRTDAAADPALAREASLYLGRCLAASEQPDRALDAFLRATPDDVRDPLWVDAIIGQADVYQGLGRTDDALRAFRKLAADRLGGVWLRITQLEVEKALGAKAAGTADWNAAKQAFGMAEKSFEGKDNVELKLLDAQLRAADGKPAEARKIIDDLFAARPKEPAVWQAKAAAQLSTPGEGLAAALATLEKGRAELGDPVDLRLAQVMLSANPNDPQAAAKLTALADGLDKYPPAARLSLTRRLAEAAAAVKARDLAGKLWAQVLAVKPNDVTTLQQQFDLARQANDEKGMEQAVEAIRKADGEAGVAAHATLASYLLWRAEQKKELTGLKDALVHLDALEKERPDWSYVPLTKAIVYDLMDRPDDALKQFERAKALGETQPGVLRRMIGLLARKGRFAEADDLFKKLPAEVRTGPDMRRVPAELALGAGDSKTAVELATQAVPADAKDPADLLWLGRLLLNAGQPAAAEKPFRTLVGQKPESPDEWLLLVESLARSGRKADAEAALAEAKGKVKKDAAALVDALGNGVLGKADEAKAAFARARTEQPASATVLAAEANYLTDTQQWAAAREAWERVKSRPGATPDEKQSANQMLAVCLAGDPDFTTAQKAIALLKDSPDDRRARITVLSIQRDRASKLEAIKLLEADRDRLAAAERFQLALLYNQVGDRGGVRLTMAELLRANPNSRLYLAFYATWLVEQKEFREADPLVTKLAVLEPDAVPTAELRVRVLAGLNNKAAARAELAKLAGRPNPPLGTLAALAEEVGLIPEAEGYFKKLVEANRDKSPEVAVLMAGFLARQNRPAEALAVCEAALKTARKVVVCQAAVEVLTAVAEPSADQLAKVAGWVDDARRAATAANEQAEFARQLAYVRNLQGKFDDAIELYRGLAAGDRPDPSVLNNLAYLISAHRQRHDEALALLAQAKGKAGPVPDLLDTEATVLTARGTKDDLKAARNLLKQALDGNPNAVAQFHLAQLEEKTGDKLAASAAWREAVRLKLKRTDLHPLEWPAYRAMEAANR
jgi:tetratricopeptide (TPR) repeat protein